MEDMSDMMKQIAAMIEKDGIPDNVKDFIKNAGNSKDTSSDEPDMSSNSSESSSPFSGFDLESMMKMKSIMDKMNVKNDPNANLLKCLKPYLKDSRKGKLDQYIQYMSMFKMLDMFKGSGGENSK